MKQRETRIDDASSRCPVAPVSQLPGRQSQVRAIPANFHQTCMRFTLKEIVPIFDELPSASRVGSHDLRLASWDPMRAAGGKPYKILAASFTVKRMQRWLNVAGLCTFPLWSIRQF